MKTIFCKREVGQRWLNALRSGKYPQARGKLQTDEGFCCLGVLEHCLTGIVEMTDDGLGNMVSCGYPSMPWLKEHNIKFLYFNGDGNSRAHCSPLLNFKDGTRITADVANDCGYSFSDIADAVEEAMEFTDDQHLI